MGESLENFIAVIVLSALCVVYLYLLLTPMQSGASLIEKRNFVLPSDTKADFEKLLQSYEVGGASGGDSGRIGDDFFLGENQMWGEGGDFISSEPIIPSDKYFCTSGWVSVRSEANYRYMWVHGDISMWLSAGATQNTPLNLRTFEVEPVTTCSEGGWVLLKEVQSGQYIFLVTPNNSTQLDEWVVKLGTTEKSAGEKDDRYHFLLEEAGYILNKGGMAFMNVFYNEEGVVRGHSASSWLEKIPARREYGAAVSYDFVNQSAIEAAVKRSELEEKAAAEQDKEEIQRIAALPISSEKRVISFGLYGGVKKYTHGAIKNAELAKIYFPGWVCRFYVTSDVPSEVVSDLRSLGSEIEVIPEGQGLISGMFHRFLVAADNSVDRYIIRDVDSRLNARDRLAVEDWIKSKKSVHILRDHVNHCNSMNGGMWGGVMGAIPHMREQIAEWSDKNMYRADMNFLDKMIWPDIMHRQIAHDSYCCDQFPNTRPFPTKRPPTYMHVGQVFDANDNPRMNDIEAFIRGVPVPGSCRGDVSWVFG